MLLRAAFAALLLAGCSAGVRQGFDDFNRGAVAGQAAQNEVNAAVLPWPPQYSITGGQQRCLTQCYGNGMCQSTCN